MATSNTTVAQTRRLAAMYRFSNIVQSKRFVSRSRQKKRGRERNLCKIKRLLVNADLRFSDVEKIDSHSHLDCSDEMLPVLDDNCIDDQVISVIESSAFAAPE
jgi:hypothetical protein